MRIAVFTDSFYPELGGIQDSIMLTCRALGERGHQLMIVAPRASRQDFRLANVPCREIDLGPNVTILRQLSLKAPGSTGQSRLFVPSGLVSRRLRAFAPQLIHTHTFLGAGLQARLSARRLRLPLIGTNHWAIGAFSGYVPLPADWVRHASLNAVTSYYNHCQLVTGPSHSVLEDMLQHGLRAPHRVLSNPIDTTLFSPVHASVRQQLKARLGLSDATIVYAGRLAREKHVDVLIQALARLRSRHPAALLILAGHGTERDRLQSLTRELGIEAQVRFVGTLDKPALAELFQAADVFALASTSETQSMVMLQAMSSGLPVVAADALALPEYVTEGSGLLAAPGDAEDFARQLDGLLADGPRRRRMGLQAQQQTRRYALDTIVSAWEALYADAAALPVPLVPLPQGAQP
ncbi:MULTISPECIES: glycosyltransferase [unclassified Paludibacterium]|uniref:glycosyltransferase n=1 Tax=unclassified Paludibacterium TaxID=2618429 RepID=UPI001C0538DD|nr:glycosyltransferase [Paludibacterium sp. B53371]BEV71524.1 glycosyltransferase family 4 protein [Paludibacterium sp. THUN1379]